MCLRTPAENGAANTVSPYRIATCTQIYRFYCTFRKQDEAANDFGGLFVLALKRANKKRKGDDVNGGQTRINQIGSY
ncbi:hypothetical protein ACFVIX_02195 [Bacillus subtilis]